MTNYFVVEALRDYHGNQFPIKVGERRVIRYGYDQPNLTPRVVQQARNGEQIDWGGATVHVDGYHVLFDGAGPLPIELRF